MASNPPVLLSDGQVQLEPLDAPAGCYAWRSTRLASGASLGAVELLADGEGQSAVRARLQLDMDPASDTADVNAMSRAVALVCHWGFASLRLTVISWLGSTDPTTRAVVHGAGFRVHPLPHRSALDGPSGPQNAWYADITVADSRQSTHRSLTAREHHVLAAMSRGRSNAEIARELGISENTVKNHVRSILDALQAPSRTAAVVFALRSGLVSLDV